MPQRSFRLDQGSLDNLSRIAEHLARLDRKPPNLTTALAWSIARGADTIDAAGTAKIPKDMMLELDAAGRLLSSLSQRWLMATRARIMSAQAEVDKDNQIAELQAEIRSLSAQLEKLRAIPYQGSSA